MCSSGQKSPEHCQWHSPFGINHCRVQVSADCPKSLNKDAGRWSFISVISASKERTTILCSVCQLLEQSKTNHFQCIFKAKWKPYCPFHLKPWAAVLGKDTDAHEQILCLLLLPFKHWARNICTRQESTTQLHTSTLTLHPIKAYYLWLEWNSSWVKH